MQKKRYAEATTDKGKGSSVSDKRTCVTLEPARCSLGHRGGCRNTEVRQQQTLPFSVTSQRNRALLPFHKHPKDCPGALEEVDVQHRARIREKEILILNRARGQIRKFTSVPERKRCSTRWNNSKFRLVIWGWASDFSTDEVKDFKHYNQKLIHVTAPLIFSSPPPFPSLPTAERPPPYGPGPGQGFIPIKGPFSLPLLLAQGSGSKRQPWIWKRPYKQSWN